MLRSTSEASKHIGYDILDVMANKRLDLVQSLLYTLLEPWSVGVLQLLYCSWLSLYDRGGRHQSDRL